ncbi:MAG: four helix bundle protein [Bacteroidia bacterium]|nr:four helix bundle protein [Bacteroidia bacterium]
MKSEKYGSKDIKTKRHAFALKVIKIYKQIIPQHKEYVLSKQLLKAGTSMVQWFMKLNLLSQSLISLVN